MSELGPYEKMTNQEKREFFRNRETEAAMKPTLGTECSKCGHVHMSIVCSCGCDISGELLKPQAKMSQPENELRAALERMRDEAKHEEKVAKEHDDLGQHSWGFKRTAEALRRWTLVLETALASRAPATTPRPGMMSAQEHVEKCCACIFGRSPCSEYRRLRDAEDKPTPGETR